MTAEKRRARNNTIESLDVALNAVRGYIDTRTDQEERLRLLGLEPDLRDLRHRFELATSPEDES